MTRFDELEERIKKLEEYIPIAAVNELSRKFLEDLTNNNDILNKQSVRLLKIENQLKSFKTTQINLIKKINEILNTLTEFKKTWA